MRAPSFCIMLLITVQGWLCPTAGYAQEQRGRVNGRVLDHVTLEPIAGAAVRLPGTTHQSVTDSDGRFALTGVTPGEYRLEVEHVAYGVAAQSVKIGATALTQLEIRLEARPVQVPALTVRILTAEERAERGRGTSSSIVNTVEIDHFIQRGADFEDVVQQRLRQIRTRVGTFATPEDHIGRRMLCISATGRGPTRLIGGARRGKDGVPGCDMVTVFLDGAKLEDPGVYLLGVSLQFFERVEWLSSIDARTRFGSLAKDNGVLLLTSRTGKRLDQR